MLAQHTLNLRPVLSMRALMVAVCAYALPMVSPAAHSQAGSEPGVAFCGWYGWTAPHKMDECVAIRTKNVVLVKIVDIQHVSAPHIYMPAKNIYSCPLTEYTDGELCYTACPAGTSADGNRFCQPETPDCLSSQYYDGTACVPAPSCPSGEHFDASAKQCVCDDGYFRAPAGHRWVTQCIRQASGEDFTTHPTWPELAQTYCTGSCMILTDGNEAEVAPTIEGLPNWGSSIPLPGADSGDPDGEDGSTTPGDSAGNNGSGGSGGGGSGTTGGGAGCQPITLPKGTNYFMVVPRLGAEKGC